MSRGDIQQGQQDYCCLLVFFASTRKLHVNLSTQQNQLVPQMTQINTDYYYLRNLQNLRAKYYCHADDADDADDADYSIAELSVKSLCFR